MLIVVRRASKDMEKLRKRTTAETTGIVIRTERRHGHNYSDYATVQYTAGNQQFSDTFLMSGVREGQEIPVRYDPADPGESMLDNEKDREMAKSFTWIAVLCMIIGVALRMIFL